MYRCNGTMGTRQQSYLRSSQAPNVPMCSKLCLSVFNTWYGCLLKVYQTLPAENVTCQKISHSQEKIQILTVDNETNNAFYQVTFIFLTQHLLTYRMAAKGKEKRNTVFTTSIVYRTKILPLTENKDKQKNNRHRIEFSWSRY